MLKAKSIDLVRAPLLPAIIKYCIPIILASLIQTLFNAADLAVLGRFDSSADSSAVGAVGATGAIVGLVVNSVIGLSGGTNVLLARAVGGGDEVRSRRITGTSMILSLGLGVVMMAVGIAFAPWFLEVTACPASSFEGAKTYLYIYFAAAPAILIYNFGAAIIRVSGDSQRPLWYMIIAGVLNVVLNLLLCFVMSDKVAAVAIATLASQAVGAVLVVIHLLRIDGPCRLDLRRIMFSARELLSIVRVGLPGAFNGALYSISNLQIQSAINSFGASATAANSASSQLEGFVNSFTGAFGVASLALIGQNLGANDRGRVKRSTLWCLLFSGGIGLVLGVSILAFGRQLLWIFLPGNELGVQFGMVRMSCILSFYWMAGLNSVLGSAIQAFGYPSLPMLNSIVTVLLFRVVWMSFIYPSMYFSGDPVSDIFNIFSCYIWSWALSLTVNAVIFTVIYIRYLRGHVKTV